MRFLISILLIALLPSLNVFAQVANPGTKRFEQDGLSFDFPSNWKLTDSSTPELHYVAVASADSAAQIIVIVQPHIDLQCQFQTAGRKVMEALVGRVASQLQAAAPLKSSIKPLSNGSEGEGLQIHGLMNDKPATADIYWLRLNLHLANLIFLRTDQAGTGTPAFETMRSSLKIASPVIEGSTLSNKPNQPGAEGNLNGRALHLVQPPYPVLAIGAHVGGTVVVEIIINESGDVVSARAIAGHQLLQADSIAAARAAKFSPTKVCGEPVRVSGVIHFNFVAR
jgi:TonB family protein